MQPLEESESRTHYVARHAKSDLQPSTSGEHLARRVVAGALLVCGLGIVAVKVVLAALSQTQATWEMSEIILVLALCGGSLAILFTATFLSVMYVIWPWGKRGT